VNAGVIYELEANGIVSGNQSNSSSGLRKWVGCSFKRLESPLSPGRGAWRGATWGAGVVLVTWLLAMGWGFFGEAAVSWLAAGFLFLGLVFALAGGLLALLMRLIGSIPAGYLWALASGVLILLYLALIALSVPVGVIVVGLATLAVASLLGSSLFVLARGGWRKATHLRQSILAAALIVGLVGAVGGGWWLLDPGSPMESAAGGWEDDEATVEPLDLPDPSQSGLYAVGKLHYGSGGDRRRPAFGVDADLLTEPVDGSALVDGWSGLRRWYWGFGPDRLPLNGTVWYPESLLGGSRRLPLVVMVHGQHPMEDVSDPGYAYLGELLASRGFIAVSIDQNFLNLSPLADLVMLNALKGPDDLRAWLILEHLEVWRQWQADEESPFYQSVDLQRVALIGHSRAGEAVATAAVFNELPAYPDDGSIRFDYGFGIQAVVAFAPVDGGYRPAGQDLVMEDVSYLVLHGAHDMDVFTFQGQGHYSRLRFTESSDGFKAALHIGGANHGQFNTRWGRKDLPEPVMRVFNLEQLMPAEDQRKVARVAVSCFLEEALHGERGYRAFFRDPRRGAAWLPDSVYVHQYQDAGTRMVATFEEDVDLTSTTASGGRLSGEHLTLWREQPAAAKWEAMDNQTVYVGWDRAQTGTAGRYEVRLPDRGLHLSEESVLVLSAADAGEDPSREGKNRGSTREETPIDWTVEVIDAAGARARLPLSHFAPLLPQAEAQLGKAAFMSPFPQAEVVLQHVELPLADFAAVNGAFDPAALSAVRFVFDRTDAAVIVLDDMGIRP